MAENLFDLAAKISVDNFGVDKGLTSTQKKVLDLAKQFEATEAVAKKSATGMAVSMAAVNAELGKTRIGNLSADYEKFSNALKNNSTNAVRAADDFLRLLGPMKGTAAEAGHVAHEGSKVTEALRALASSAVIVDGPLGGVAGRLRGVSAETTELTALFGPLGILIAGVTVGAGGLALAIWEVSKKTAEYGEEIYKAEVKTGLTAGMLSTLKVIATETSSSFEGLTTSAARLQVGISKGITEKSGEAERALKTLGLQTQEFRSALPDQQLVMTAKAIVDLTNQSDKNRAAQALLSRGWLQSADALKDLAEHYDEARAKADAFGLMMSQQDVEAAVKFEHALKDLALGVEGLGVQVGQKTIPAIEAAMSELASTLGLNESSWKSWGEYIGNVLSGVVINTSSAVAAIGQSINNLKSFFGSGFSQINRIGASAAGVMTGNPGAANALYGEIFGSSTDPYNWKGQLTPSQAYDSEQRRMQNQTANSITSGALPRGGGASTFAPGGGGGKHGKDSAISDLALEKETLKGLEQMFKAEQEAYDRSLKFRKTSLAGFVAVSSELELARHAATEAILLKELFTAEKVKDAGKRKLDVQKALNALAAEHYKATKTIEANEDKLREDSLARDKTYEEGKLAIYDIVANQQRAQVANNVNWRVLTETEGAKKIGRIELDLLDKRIEYLNKQFSLAGENESEQLRINMELGAMEAKRAAQIEANATAERDAEQSRIDRLRSLLSTLRQMNDEANRSLLNSRRAGIGQDVSTGRINPSLSDLILGRAPGAKQTARIDAEEETQRHLQVLAELYARMDVELTKKTEEEKAKIREAYAKLIHAEDVATENKQREIQERDLVLLTSRLHSLAGNITSVLDQAIHDGFDKGIKEGFRSMALGFLQMLEKMAEEWLASSIFRMLQDVFKPSGSGGGGFWGKLLGSIIGGAAGGVGGGGGSPVPNPWTAPPLAGGMSYVPYDNFPAILHKGERVMTAAENRSSAPNVTIQVFAHDVHSFGSVDTQRQVADKYRRVMQHAALTG